MKIYHDLQQGSPEWLDVRRRNFTASELGPWALEPITFRLNVDEIKTKLDELGVPRKGITKKSDLIELLPFPAIYRELCDGAKTAIISKIKQGRMIDLEARDFDELTEEETIWLDRERELAAQSEKQFSYNIPVKYGKLLEPFARDWYEKHAGLEVTEVGFIEHDSGGFGCSPDGLVLMDQAIICGLEIKCPVPETHIEWLLAGVLPENHSLQCHAGMAATGLDRWDFLSYCPGETPLLITVERDETTERLEAGLKTLVAEKSKMKAKLSEIWRASKP